jgi:adenylylsulfate kinase-like enzyme
LLDVKKASSGTRPLEKGASQPKMSPPMAVFTVGIPGCGKTTLAHNQELYAGVPC